MQLILGSASAPSTITLGNGTAALTLTFQRTAALGGTTVINDIIQNASGGGAGNLVVQNNATVILNAANTYTGVTTVKAGGLLSTNLLANGGTASNLGQSSNAAANLVVDGATLQYTGPAVSTDRLFTLSANGGTGDASGTGPVNFTNTGSMGLSGTTARILTLTGTNAGTNTLSAVIADVRVGNATSLTKSGSGTWLLAGSNTYSGDTNINAGTLLVNNATGSGTGAGNVNVNNTGALGGTGIIAPGSGKSVTVASGGTISPGTAAAPTGVLKVNGLVTLQSGSQLAAALGSNATQTSNSLDLSTSGSVNFATGSKLGLSAISSGFTNTGGSAYILATLGGGNGGNILLDGTSLADQQVIGTYVAGTGPSGAVVIDPGSITLAAGDAFTLFRNGDNLALTFSPVPEPAHILLLCGVAATELRRLRRQV